MLQKLIYNVEVLYMGFPKRMAAALPNNVVKNHGANVNQIQFGDKLQGLVSVTNRRVGVNRYVRTQCGGQLPGRATIFCVNQLGGVGNVKNSPFAPNADGVKECKHEVYGAYNGKYDGNYKDRWEFTLPRFPMSIKLNSTPNQLSLLERFENYQYNEEEEYHNTNNTPYAIINLRQEYFAEGTLQIRVPGVYVLREDITFHPNPLNGFMPTREQMESGRYPSMREGGAYHLGFFAAITIESHDVILDLNGYTIKQSKEHNLMQRFYANIEVANSPFILNQGPGSFTTKSTYKAANNLMIMNGTLGRSSHHGVHGNKATNIIIKDIKVEDFEVAGIALNGVTNAILMDIDIMNTTRDVPVLSSFSQAVFALPLLRRIESTDSSYRLGDKPIGDIIRELDSMIEQTKRAVLSSNSMIPIPELFRNNERMSGYDGNVYGIVLNVNGVVINDFLQTRPDDAIGNKDVCLYNINIKNLLSRPVEIIALSKAAEKDLPQGALAYGGKRQVGPAGDVLDILKITGSSQQYKPNALADAQLIIGKYANEKQKKMGTVNILSEIISWAETGTPTLHDILNGPLDLYYVKNGDSMGHVMKGSIGLFISGGLDIKADYITIDEVVNKGELIDLPNKTGNTNAPYQGATSSGILITGSQRVDIMNASISNIVSQYSQQYHVRMVGENSDVSFNNQYL